MQVHRVTITVIDFDQLGSDGVREALETARFPNDCVSLNVQTVETRDIGPWSDDHPLNQQDTYATEIERIFSTPSPQ